MTCESLILNCRQIIPVFGSKVAGDTIKRKPILTRINIAIQAVQSPVVDTCMEAIGIRLAMSLDQTIPGEHRHRLDEHEFMAGQFPKPRRLVYVLIHTKEVIPDVLVIEIG